MLLFPNCKINLGLSIINKREDGYHNIETVFLPVPLQDALEIVRQPGENQEIEFTNTGLAINGDTSSNLCVKAFWLLKNDFPQLPPVKMHLHKTIPMGAGLGGGSADGAFTLVLLNNKFKLGLSNEKLVEYALKLGSDCPFFIVNTPCFAEGRGEIMQQVTLPLSGYYLLLVNPGIHVPTGWAFAQITSGKPVKSPRIVVSQPIDTWKDELVNDFEAPVFNTYPQLHTIKQQLYAHGALYAGMSGSGSTFFGIFKARENIPGNIFPAGYFIKQFELPC